MVGIRAGINRYLQDPPNHRILNIIKDREFQSANKVLSGKIKTNRREGLDKTRHKEVIPPGDIQKLYSSGVLSNSNPENLQYKVFFEVSLHFGRRGREGWHALKKDSFQFFVDDSKKDCEYVTIAVNEVTKKNHGINTVEEKDQRMYAAPGHDDCPVKSLKLYLSKLSRKEDSFLQTPRKIYKLEDDAWYFGRMGINTIENFMKKISTKAKLTKIYTN